MAVDPARGLEPAGLNREARELDPAFVRDRVDRLTSSTDYGDFSSPLCKLWILWGNHDILTKVSQYGSGARGPHVQQTLHDGESHHDPWLGKLKSASEGVGTLKIASREHGKFLTVATHSRGQTVSTL